MNRVVITGFGVASPIGNDAEETFLENLKKEIMVLDPLLDLTPAKLVSR